MLPSSFTAHIADLELQSKAQSIAAVMPGVVGRDWQIPSTYPVGTDIQDPAGFIVACDRSTINQACVDEYQAGMQPNAGRRGVVMALKTAIDYQAAYERALHARHASGVRCRVWAAARRAGHGDQNFGVFAVVQASLESTISASQSVDNTSQPQTP